MYDPLFKTKTDQLISINKLKSKKKNLYLCIHLPFDFVEPSFGGVLRYL